MRSLSKIRQADRQKSLSIFIWSNRIIEQKTHNTGGLKARRVLCVNLLRMKDYIFI